MLIGDGMADIPIEELGNKTILQHSNTPYMDYMAKNGVNGLAKTVPDNMPPGSDVANMSLLGYDPKKYYSGRAPLEAASMGVELAENDIAFRCNLVTLKNNLLQDYSAGHISTEHATQLINHLNSAFCDDSSFQMYPGMSYKHLLIAKEGLGTDTLCKPPHDIMGQFWKDNLPTGKDSESISEIITKSYSILEHHPLNLEKVKNKQSPANSIWLWGQGKAPEFPAFNDMYGIKGSVISAVDLIKGIGIYSKLDVIEVPGATGYFDTDYKAKAEYAINALTEQDQDIVFVHVEAPDEAGHIGSIKEKVRAVENFDEKVVGTILSHIKDNKETYRVLITPDHPTPIKFRTHTADPVPFIIYSNNSIQSDHVESYDENAAIQGSLGQVMGYDLINTMMNL